MPENYVCFCIFFRASGLKIHFCRRDWTPGCVFMQFWDFANISLFPRILSSKSFSNCWGNHLQGFLYYTSSSIFLEVNRTCGNTLQNFSTLYQMILWTFFFCCLLFWKWLDFLNITLLWLILSTCQKCFQQQKLKAF